jgi:hypothetical protein
VSTLTDLSNTPYPPLDGWDSIDNGIVYNHCETVIMCVVLRIETLFDVET